MEDSTVMLHSALVEEHLLSVLLLERGIDGVSLAPGQSSGPGTTEVRCHHLVRH